MQDSLKDGAPAADGLFPVIEMPIFRERYPPEILRPRARHTERVAQALRERLGPRSILGLAFYPWHDQTTLWWFEQGMLTLLAATGWETVWVTDAHYTFDDERLAELDGRISILRDHTADPHWEPPNGRFDAVIALFPCDRATRVARDLGVPLITFAIKQVRKDEPRLVESPPPGTPLWHAFAGSTNFEYGMFGPLTRPPERRIGRLGSHAGAWRVIGAPFPANRYYFPVRPARPIFDALLFGSKARDYETAFAALARAGVRNAAATARIEDDADVKRTARQHGINLVVHQPMSHVRLLDVLEQSRIVVNPIVPPDESHYSLSVPFALGRPIVATDVPCVRPFSGPGALLAAQGDVAAWAECIARLLRETASGVPHAATLKQGQERHDVDRFFALAILATLTGTVNATNAST